MGGREKGCREAPVLGARAAWWEVEGFRLGYVDLNVPVGPLFWNSRQRPGLKSTFGGHGARRPWRTRAHSQGQQGPGNERGGAGPRVVPPGTVPPKALPTLLWHPRGLHRPPARRAPVNASSQSLSDFCLGALPRHLA